MRLPLFFCGSKNACLRADAFPLCYKEAVCNLNAKENSMRRTFFFSFTLLSLSVFIVPALAAEPQQLYTTDQSVVWDREKVGQGGVGTLFGKYPFNRNTAAKEFIIREIGWMTLKPGDSIGMHKHETNEDAYVILSGEGAFIDSDGKEYTVKAGDTTIARKGQSHALKNTGGEPLVFLDVVAER